MNYLDIACIVFICVTANHLGLIAAIKSVTKCNHLWVIDCPKCLTFWSILCYQLIVCQLMENQYVPFWNVLRLLAISLLASYTAIWLELLEGIIDKLYTYVYEQIYPTADTADTDTFSADNTVPDVSEEVYDNDAAQ